MRSARMLFIAVMCCAAASSWAQPAQLPTPADLKAAYCVKVYRAGIDFFSSVLNMGGPSAPEAFKSKMQEMIDRENAGLRRIKLYLLPRLQFLDPTSIAAAMASADADLAEANKVAEQCKCELEDAACRDRCAQHSESSGRLQSCQDLSFLPF